MMSTWSITIVCIEINFIHLWRKYSFCLLMKVMIHDDDGDIEDAAAEDNDDDEDMRQTPLWK